MATLLLSSVLALANDKGALYDAAAADVTRATVATIMHGDTSLFVRTLEQLDSRKGATAKAIAGRLRAAGLAAKDARETAYPNGRKGKATAEETATAESTAAPIAEAFKAACLADAAERSAKAKEAQATGRAKREEAAKAAPLTPASIPLAQAESADVVAAIMARGVEYASGIMVALRTAIELAGQQAEAKAAEALASASAKSKSKSKSKSKDNVAADVAAVPV